jgi:hypothetical protein
MILGACLKPDDACLSSKQLPGRRFVDDTARGGDYSP